MHLKSRFLYLAEIKQDDPEDTTIFGLKERRLDFSTFNRIPRGWIYDTIPVSSVINKLKNLPV